jgi:hypothetical protein
MVRSRSLNMCALTVVRSAYRRWRNARSRLRLPVRQRPEGRDDLVDIARHRQRTPVRTGPATEHGAAAGRHRAAGGLPPDLQRPGPAHPPHGRLLRPLATHPVPHRSDRLVDLARRPAGSHRPALEQRERHDQHRRRRPQHPGHPRGPHDHGVDGQAAHHPDQRGDDHDGNRMPPVPTRAHNDIIRVPTPRRQRPPVSAVNMCSRQPACTCRRQRMNLAQQHGPPEYRSGFNHRSRHSR